MPAFGCHSFSKTPTAPTTQLASYEETGETTDGSWVGQIDRTYKELTGQAAKPEEARKVFEEGEALYRQAVAGRATTGRQQLREKFLEAAETLKRAARLWPDSAVAEDASFLAGEAYFFADRYPDANEMFEQLLKDYPNTRYQDLVQARRFAIARYWLKYHQQDPQPWYEINISDESRPWNDLKGHALRLFKQIPLDDPTGELADDAILAQANALFVARRYDDADRLYDDIRTMYPTSEHQFTAHLMGVKTKLLRYQGPEYDGSVLEEAEKLIEQIRIQFPREAQANADLLDRAAREVRYRKAEREWLMARFYDRRKAYQAARFYYQIIQRDYADTPFAQQAQTRMAEIRDKPPHPPQYMRWLVKLFPSSEPETPLLKSGNSVRR